MSTGTFIRVLVVEDSPTMRELLCHVLEADPAIRVVKTVCNGEEAVAAVTHCRPDVITMDVHMPRMDGFDATRRIMATRPVPIIIVSGTLTDQVAATFRAIEAGALAFVRHPSGPGNPDHEGAAAELVQMVKLMSEVKVVRRWLTHGKLAVSTSVQGAGAKIVPGEVKLVAVGASTGGPAIVQSILSMLPGRLRVPMLVVQHIAAGFVAGFAEWLDQSCGLPVHVAQNGEIPMPGHVYIAPEGAHMGIDRSGRIALSDAAPDHGLRPSVSHLFRSVAAAVGPDAIGILLTGMGKDGAEELKLMKDRGAITIAQDQQSSVIHGMPGEAIRLEGAAYVLAPDEIAALLTGLALKET
ncbi:MAG: chemotaxis-specific protein-glutamate methyltransferase CheB [Gammaproteobacteria bacterium]|nr:chemotaxis-specific protein-glutamate methyltransferase CheB [Gammaproteobacteria bacterium]